LAALYPLRDATEVFLDTLGPEHEVALFTIARNLQRRVDFATDREELKASAEEISWIQARAPLCSTASGRPGSGTTTARRPSR
jgi:hypothetical protein